MQIEVAGERALIVYFSGTDLLEQNALVTALVEHLQRTRPDWLVDWIPSYHSVLVEFDPYKTDFLAVKAFLRKPFVPSTQTKIRPGKEHILPVLYDYPADNDLKRIATHHGISNEKVVELHQSMVYRVFAVGFSPGFAFLGEVPDAISMPRLPTPRMKVPKGAVAIADKQTAVYPAASPGGWNIIGLCPTLLFDPVESPPGRLQVGDKVRFRAISTQEYMQNGGLLDG